MPEYCSVCGGYHPLTTGACPGPLEPETSGSVRYLKGRWVVSLEEQRGMECPLPPETEGPGMSRRIFRCCACGSYLDLDETQYGSHVVYEQAGARECGPVYEVTETEGPVNTDYVQQLIEQRDAALDALGKAEERAAALEAVAEAVRDWIANGGRESITYSQRLREHYDHLLGTGWLPRAEREEP